MSWIKRQIDEHKCTFPVNVYTGARITCNKTAIPNARTGDIWECDSLGCFKRYQLIIHRDQRDGDYIEFAPLN